MSEQTSEQNPIENIPLDMRCVEEENNLAKKGIEGKVVSIRDLLIHLGHIHKGIHKTKKRSKQDMILYYCI
jgi:hypothetical protein